MWTGYQAYHNNNKLAWDGSNAYHDNGQLAWGKPKASTAYHANGAIAWDGSNAYDATGKFAGQEGIEIYLGPDIKMHIGKNGFELFVCEKKIASSADSQ